MSKLLKVFLIASFAVASFSAKAVTVASWGGAYTESQQKAYADTYSDPSSIPVSYTHLTLPTKRIV